MNITRATGVDWPSGPRFTVRPVRFEINSSKHAPMNYSILPFAYARAHDFNSSLEVKEMPQERPKGSYHEMFAAWVDIFQFLYVIFFK